jgi:hypothetical protein
LTLFLILTLAVPSLSPCPARSKEIHRHTQALIVNKTKSNISFYYTSLHAYKLYPLTLFQEEIQDIEMQLRSAGTQEFLMHSNYIWEGMELQRGAQRVVQAERHCSDPWTARIYS